MSPADTSYYYYYLSYSLYPLLQPTCNQRMIQLIIVSTQITVSASALINHLVNIIHRAVTSAPRLYNLVLEIWHFWDLGFGWCFDKNFFRYPRKEMNIIVSFSPNETNWNGTFENTSAGMYKGMIPGRKIVYLILVFSTWNLILLSHLGIP